MTRQFGPTPRVTWLPWMACLLLVILAGCRPQVSDRDTAGGSPEPKQASRPTPEELLERMIRVYREAPVYSDRGEIVLSYRSGGSLRRDAAPLRVAFQRPGKLKMEAYQVRLAADGERLQARIQDEATGHLDNQVLVREVPPQLTLPWLMEDSLLHEVLRQGLGRQPIQLELLLGSNPIAPFLAPDVRREFLEDQTLHGHRCHRLRVDTGEGPFVFWIDQQDGLLRRLEYPTSGLRPSAEARSMVTDMKLVADFREARLAATGEDFRGEDWSQLEGVQQVRRFVRPPQPLPTNLFAERLPAFRLQHVADETAQAESAVGAGSAVEAESEDSAVDGATDRQSRGAREEGNRYFGSDQMQGQVVVLHWYADHPACWASLERLRICGSAGSSGRLERSRRIGRDN
jgi:hypothetical protein